MVDAGNESKNSLEFPLIPKDFGSTKPPEKPLDSARNVTRVCKKKVKKQVKKKKKKKKENTHFDATKGSFPFLFRSGAPDSPDDNKMPKSNLSSCSKCLFLTSDIHFRVCVFFGFFFLTSQHARYLAAQTLRCVAALLT